MKIKIIFIVLILLLLSNISYSKFINEIKIDIANINIDTIAPDIELITSEKKEKNDIFSLDIKIKVIENNININKLKDNIVILANEIEIEKSRYQIQESKEYDQALIYEIIILNIKDINKVKVKIPENTIIDFANNGNALKIIEIQG